MTDIKKIKIMFGPCTERSYGFIFEPEKEEERKDTAIILCHGYNNCMGDIEDVALALAAEGYTALTFDFRGGGNKCISMGKTTEMSVKTEVLDAEDAIGFIRRTRPQQSKNLYLYGESQGGLVASLAGASMSDKVSGLFLLYPAYCIPDQMKNVDYGESGVLNVMNMDISKKYSDELPEFDIYEMMKFFGKPITIAHGDKDPIVPLRYAQRLYDQQKALGYDVTLDIFENEGHGFSPEAREKWRKLILKRLKEVQQNV